MDLEKQFKERRDHPRVLCKIRDVQGHFVYNVSESGLYCETDQSYNQNQELVISIFSPQLGSLISLRVTVARVVGLDRSQFGYGFRFNLLESKARQEFHGFILHNSAAQSSEVPKILFRKDIVSKKRQWDVVVVGGGIAGLVAARKLRKTGRDVLLLEGDNEVGGRLRSKLVGGVVPIDVGAQFFAEKAGIFRLIKDLKLNDQVIPVSTKLAVWGKNGDQIEIHSFDLKAPWRGWGRKVFGGFFGLVRSMFTYPDLFRLLPRAIATKVFKSMHSNLRYWAGLDQLDFEKTSGDWIRRAFGDQALNQVMGSVMYGFLFEHPQQTSAAIAKWFFTSLLGLELYTLKSGFGSVALALGKEIEDVIQTGTPVREIKVRNEKSVTVKTFSGEIEAQQVILAVPTSVIREKKLYKPSHSIEKKLIENARFASAVVVTLLTRDRDWLGEQMKGIYTIFTPLNSSSPIGCVSLESGKIGKTGTGDECEVAQFYFRPEASRELMYENDEVIFEKTLYEAKVIFPGLLKAVVKTYYVWKWENALPQFPPGFVRTINDYLRYIRQNRPPVVLAGDGVNFVGIDAARHSGEVAACYC